jgi:hypothetical protein
MNVADILYDFSKGIPFKSGQSTLNFEVLWSAVSILVSGVIDTAEFLYKVCIVESAVSLAPPS